MQTKGVASVRSPVCNLRQQRPSISHEDFVHAVVREFQNRYDVREMVGETFFFFLSENLIANTPSQIKWVEEGSDCEGIEEITKGMHDLKVSLQPVPLRTPQMDNFSFSTPRRGTGHSARHQNSHIPSNTTSVGVNS